MPTYRLNAQLSNRFTGGELVALKDKALEYLGKAESAFDEVGAAKHIGLRVSEFLELRNLFHEEFFEQEQALVLRLEARLRRGALGLEPLSGTESTMIRWILGRRTNKYAGLPPAKHRASQGADDEPQTPNGLGAQILEKHKQ